MASAHLHASLSLVLVLPMVLLRQAAAPQDADSKSEMSVLHELRKRSYFYICNNSLILNQWHGVSTLLT